MLGAYNPGIPARLCCTAGGFEVNCGKQDPKNVAAVKEINTDFHLKDVFEEYEKRSYESLTVAISKQDDPAFRVCRNGETPHLHVEVAGSLFLSNMCLNGLDLESAEDRCVHQ